MTLSAYCHKKGMTLEQYKTLKQNIDTITTALIQQIPNSKKGHGMYYPITDLIPYNTNRELRPYYIQAFKEQGVEFIENNEYWRL